MTLISDVNYQLCAKHVRPRRPVTFKILPIFYNRSSAKSKWNQMFPALPFFRTHYTVESDGKFDHSWWSETSATFFFTLGVHPSLPLNSLLSIHSIFQLFLQFYCEYFCRHEFIANTLFLRSFPLSSSLSLQRYIWDYHKPERRFFTLASLLNLTDVNLIDVIYQFAVQPSLARHSIVRVWL